MYDTLDTQPSTDVDRAGIFDTCMQPYMKQNNSCMRIVVILQYCRGSVFMSVAKLSAVRG